MNRQQKALFKFLAPVALALALVLSGGLYHIVSNPSLFTFRQGGTGATAGNQSDQQFITAQEKAAQWKRTSPVPTVTKTVLIPGPVVTVTKTARPDPSGTP